MIAVELSIVGHQMMMVILLSGSMHHIAILRMALVASVWHGIIVTVPKAIRTETMVRMIGIESMLVEHVAVHRCEIIAKVMRRMHAIAVHAIETVRVVAVVE